MMMITDYWCPVQQYEWGKGKGVKYIKCVVCAEYIYNLATVVGSGHWGGADIGIETMERRMRP